MAAGWCSRTLRAALFAAVCVLLAALGHVMMSGSEVPAWALAASVALTGATGWSLAGRERGLPLIVTVVLAAQTVLHTAFSLTERQPSAGAVEIDSMDMGGMVGMSGMGRMRHAGHMEHMEHMQHTGPMDPWGEAVGMGVSSSFGMLAAHLLAALLCGLWLAHGERAVFRILRAVAGWLAAPLRLLLLALPVVPERPRVRVGRRGSERAPRLLLLSYAITTRGPPLRTAAAV
ncbi:hypothetical protein ACWD4O_21155 [Streptomyces sp. NPDC002623]